MWKRKPCVVVFLMKASVWTDVRQLKFALSGAKVGYLPGPHGSAIFTRGETQSLTSVTLGTKLDEKIVDDVLDQHRERFLLHYNFPHYSTGEAKAQRGVGRREIGTRATFWHGVLLENGQIPAGYPYTVRVVSDIMESNGSSSMATVCAGTHCINGCRCCHEKTSFRYCHGLD